jgi:O-acetyl-ADP-ribose deacetylase (regulator of RNase III)
MQSKSIHQKVRFGNMLQMERGILVHGCNAQGVMGSGIAAQIRFRYPSVYEDYHGVYKNEGLKVGDVIFSDIDPAVGFHIANAITQENFGREKQKYVSYEGVFEAFKKIFKEAEDRGLDVHYPQIGAGLAGGDWATIQTCIDAAFNETFKGISFDLIPNRTLWIFE